MTTKEKTIMKRRIKAANELFNNSANQFKAAHTGYLKLDDGNIAITDGTILYVGNMIADIDETEHPDNFCNVVQFMDNAKYLETEFEIDLDIDDIKKKYKIAKENVKLSGVKRITKAVYSYGEPDGEYKVTNDNNGEAYFNSELIIRACDIIGGGEFTMYVDNGRSIATKPALIKGENGSCIVMPFMKR